MIPADKARVVAVLGPTNTGKTHLAIERMLAYRNGMIGFPLRLLARENYDRIVRIRGPKAVALITGEEKILPAHPSYFVCTVEAMPLDRRVAFLAVDEIQLCADPERGHVFTDRLLHARGLDETMFLGAETIKPLLRRLVPEAQFINRPRFSQLVYTGAKKLTRLPPRSVVVAFSAAEVYAIAEIVRGQRGGTAVVLGALSPRTRNAQVAMYQAGEVDYLVATDAIGMGLNMDVDHVAFAALRKFDGAQPRALTAPEVAQIAGRAGRHMNDGTFGTLAEIGGLDPMLVEAVENHRFDALKALSWRNADLRFTSAGALIASLNAPSPLPGLVRARDADDQLALASLAAEPDIKALASHPQAVRLLWEVCRIPDFRKTLSESHTRLLGQIFRHLGTGEERLPTDWVARHVSRLERIDGDIDTLVGRIANVRTWTYVSHRAEWMADAAHWQERTRALEDRLSDALHDRLTQRFVDRRTSVLMRRMKEEGSFFATIADGEVSVEGQFLGRLDGFRFRADATGNLFAARALSNAAERALRGEIARRLTALEAEPDTAFALDAEGVVLWREAAVAVLATGLHPLRPVIDVLPGDQLEPMGRDRLRQRLAAWLEAHVARAMAPLAAPVPAAASGAVRGILFQLAEALGSMRRTPAAALVAALTPEDRTLLARLDVRLGRESLFIPRLLKPGAVALRGLLWAVHRGVTLPPLPPAGRVSLPAGERPSEFLEAVGYRVLGGRALRVDVLERLAAEARRLGRDGAAFAATPLLMSLAACSAVELAGVLAALGFRAVMADSGTTFRAAAKPRRPVASARSRPDADSPFAGLLARPR